MLRSRKFWKGEVRYFTSDSATLLFYLRFRNPTGRLTRTVLLLEHLRFLLVLYNLTLR